MQVRNVQMVDLVPSPTRLSQGLCIPKDCKDAFTFRYHVSAMCLSRLCIWTNIMSQYYMSGRLFFPIVQKAKRVI